MRYALAGAGSVRRSFLADLPRLHEQLGPVAANSARLASRIANSLGAGSPARSMDDLNGSRTILLCCIGGSTGESVIDHLSEANIAWGGKTLLLCDSNLYSDDVPKFRERGAATGSINRMGETPGKFAIEGDPAAIRAAKFLAQELRAKPVELDRGKMQTYGAALTFSSSLFTPLIESCVECLHEAGLTRASARQEAESLFQCSIRAYMHTGRKGWFGTVASGKWKTMEKEIEGLLRSKPLLAGYYRMSAVFALEFYKEYPELANRLKLTSVPAAGAHGGHPGSE